MWYGIIFFLFKWGPEYDETLKAWKYDAPNVCARLAMKYLNVKKKIHLTTKF